VPTINRSFSDLTWQPFVQAAPFSGTAHVVNNGAFAFYIEDMVTGNVYKTQPAGTRDIPIVQGRDYTVLVCGDVSITYTLIPA
jgi:hypothetical protein